MRPTTNSPASSLQSLVRGLMAAGGAILLAVTGARCFSDLVQPVPKASQVSLTLAPSDSALVAIGDHVAPFAGSLLVNGSPSSLPFHLKLTVQAPDSGVVQVIETAADQDSLAVLKRGTATISATPLSSLIAGEPTAVTRKVRAVVPLLANDTIRTATNPRTQQFVSLGDTVTLKACGFTRTALISCNPSLPVTWSVSAGTAATLKNAATGLVQALSNGSATFVGAIDAVSTSWTVTVAQVARRVRYISGSGLTDTAGATLTQPFIVQISDANDSTAHLANVPVGWKVTAGGGAFSGATDTANSVTDANGRASVTLKLGAAGTQSVLAGIANLLGSRASFGATAYQPQPPARPTTVLQLKSDCATQISVGGSTDELSACFSATLTHGDPGATIRLAVEVQPLGTAFTGVASAVSTPVASGASAAVTVTGLLDDVGYHWQFWAVDHTNRTSAVTAWGQNAESATDLAVARPTVVLTPTTATFTATQGGSNPASQTVNVTSGGTVLRGLAVGTIAYGSGSGWLATATLNTTTSPATLTLQPAVGSLVASTYTATVPITASNAKNNPQTVSVTFTVNPPPPAIALNPTSVTFTAPLGGSGPAAKTVAVTNSGGLTLSGLAIGTISYGAGATGWLAAGVSPTTAPATVTLTPTLGSLTAGTYTATVPVTSTTPGVTNSPQNISVTFTVTAPDLVVTHYTASRSVPVGDSIAVNAITVNQGTAASGRYHAALYWSTSLPVTTSSNMYGWWTLSGLAVGAADTTTGTLPVPGAWSPGTQYYYAVIVDDSNYVTESNESNNKLTDTVFYGNSQLVTDGGFENGAASWSVAANSGQYVYLVNNCGAHGGTHFLEFGASYSSGCSETGVNNYFGYAYQKVTIPPGVGSATLSFYYLIWTNESSSSTTAWDSLSVHLDDTTFHVLAVPASLTVSNLDAVTWGTYSWKKASYDVTAYAGTTIVVYFKATTDGSNYTLFKLDDVSLTWTRGLATSPPVARVRRPGTRPMADVSAPWVNGSPGAATAPTEVNPTRQP